MEYENTIQIITITLQNKSVGFPLDLTEKIREYGRLGLEGAFNTQRAYKADLKDFNTWCEINGQTPFPVSPETLAAYVSHLADACKWATINRKLAAISKLHQLNDLETPTQNRMIRVVMEGIKRSKGVRQRQAPAFKINELKKIFRDLDAESNGKLRLEFNFQMQFSYFSDIRV